MGWPRLLQLLALLWVTVVMIGSYLVSDMAFEFGGLALGVVVFLYGRSLEGRPER